jgi:hypothetical protein
LIGRSGCRCYHPGMAKPLDPDAVAASLSIAERALLFWIATRSDWHKVGVPGETITIMIVKGLVDCGEGGRPFSRQ